MKIPGKLESSFRLSDVQLAYWIRSQHAIFPYETHDSIIWFNSLCWWITKKKRKFDIQQPTKRVSMFCGQVCARCSIVRIRIGWYNMFALRDTLRYNIVCCMWSYNKSCRVTYHDSKKHLVHWAWGMRPWGIDKGELGRGVGIWELYAADT